MVNSRTERRKLLKQKSNLEAKLYAIEENLDKLKPSCTMCDSERVRKFGLTKDYKRRYECKACGHHFTLDTMTKAKKGGISCPCGRNFIQTGNNESNKYLTHIKQAYKKGEELFQEALKEKDSNNKQFILAKEPIIAEASKQKGYCVYYMRKRIAELCRNAEKGRLQYGVTEAVL